MNRNFKRLGATILTLGIAASTLTACGNDGDSEGDNTVKIGTTDASKNAWRVFEKEAKAEGINLEVVSFNDYNTPNQALSEKQLDANLFQHIKFLATYNVKSNDKLVPVGATEIVPLALFYKDHKKVDEIQDGTEVVVPNDTTNQGRAINMLANEGLLKLKNPDALNPSPADIDTAASKVKIVPVDAAQTATAYNEGRPAVINNTFLLRAGIDPKTAIAQDDPKADSAKPYINVLVAREDNKDNDNLKKLVKVWHSPAVQKANDEDSKGTSVSVDLPADELQEILTTTEDKVRQSS